MLLRGDVCAAPFDGGEMTWNFETDPAFQRKLDWMSDFVRSEVEPLDLVFTHPADPFDPARAGPAAAMAPLKKQVQEQGLWACHLGPELGGQGYGQVKLGLMNEILGRSRFAPTVFGCQAPDTGNSEILARFGTAEQKRRYLEPLLAGTIASCYSMTEPQAGADPAEFKCRADLVGDHWIINGEKWFASHAEFAKFLLLVVITNPAVPVHQGASILIVDRDAPGLEVVRNVAVGMREAMGSGVHGYLRFTDCRVPRDEHSRSARPGIRGRSVPTRWRAHPPRDAHGRPAESRARHDVRAGIEPPHER